MTLHRRQPRAGGSAWVREALRIERSFFTAQPLAHKEPVGGDAQARVMMKASPVAPLVVMQSELGLQFLIVALDPPAALGGSDEGLQRSRARQGGEPVVPGLGVAGGPLYQHPLLLLRLTVVRRPHPQGAEARGERSGGAFAPGDATELSGGQTARQLQHRDRCVRGITNRSGARSTSLARGARHRCRLMRPAPDLGVVANADHIREASRAQLISPRGLGSIGSIGEHCQWTPNFPQFGRQISPPG